MAPQGRCCIMLRRHKTEEPVLTRQPAFILLLKIPKGITLPQKCDTHQRIFVNHRPGSVSSKVLELFVSALLHNARNVRQTVKYFAASYIASAVALLSMSSTN